MMYEGKSWVFGDNVDTDQLAPGAFMKSPMEELARHCLERLNPHFPKNVRVGDIVVGGRNFGAGSSREQAVQSLLQLGVSAVVAQSFGGIFQRNAFNLGLLVLECEDTSKIHEGDHLVPDPKQGSVFNQTTGETLICSQVPEFLMQMLEDGGLVPHLEKKINKGNR